MRITHVLETHIHNDYVTGGLELSRVAGAEYVVPAGDDVDYQRRAIHDGDVIDAGPIQLQAVHTPGHTHHHVTYVLRDRTGTTIGVFTGGSMLHGTTGRTDLLGDEHTNELTHAQFHSVRRLADELPDDAQVYPTHGFGSFCSATPASGDSSTIAEQRTEQPRPYPRRADLRRRTHRRTVRLPRLLRPHGRHQQAGTRTRRPLDARTGRPRRVAPPHRGRASGSSTSATAPPSPPVTSTAPSPSSCPNRSSPTSDGSTPGARR